jgi:hypothetical protein
MADEVAGPRVSLVFSKRKGQRFIRSYDAEIRIDGHVLRGVRCVEFEASGGDALPKLRLDMMPGELDISGPVECLLTSEGRRLVRLDETELDISTKEG